MPVKFYKAFYDYSLPKSEDYFFNRFPNTMLVKNITKEYINKNLFFQISSMSVNLIA